MVRWLNVLLRALHLMAVIALGAVLLGAPLAGGRLALAVLASGAALMALDLGVRPARFWEWSSAAVLVKLLLVGWMALDEAPRLLLFWGLVAWSVVFAHAPASVRHRRWWGADS